MNNRFENLTDGGDVGLATRLPRNVSDEIREAAWAHLRRQVGNNLLEAIYSSRTPVVVEVQDDARPALDWQDEHGEVLSDILSIRVRLTPVATSQVEMFEPTPPDVRAFKAMTPRAKLRTIGKLLRGAYLEKAR